MLPVSGAPRLPLVPVPTGGAQAVAKPVQGQGPLQALRRPSAPPLPWCAQGFSGSPMQRRGGGGPGAGLWCTVVVCFCVLPRPTHTSPRFVLGEWWSGGVALPPLFFLAMYACMPKHVAQPLMEMSACATLRTPADFFPVGSDCDFSLARPAAHFHDRSVARGACARVAVSWWSPMLPLH